MNDTDRIKELSHFGPMTDAETEELHHLLETSDSPIAVIWRRDMEQIKARIEKIDKELLGQGRMTKARKRYLKLSQTPICDMSDAEREELRNLSNNSDCPEARNFREWEQRVIKETEDRCKRITARMGACGVETNYDRMTPDQKTLGAYFGTSPEEIERYIINMQNAYRGLTTVGTGELTDTRCFADKKKQADMQSRGVAHLGGKATAHYTDAQVTQAFREYKLRHSHNSPCSPWDAANALVRDGQPLDGYKDYQGPWKRIKRMADNGHGITPEQWFNDL